MSELKLLSAFVGAPEINQVYNVDAMTLLKALPAGSVNCIVTSPPYYSLRDYQIPGQIGLEDTPQEFVTVLRDLFREARRVLRDDGTFWLNLGDTYSNAGKWGGNKGYDNKQSTNSGSIRRTARNAKDIGAKPKDLLMIPARVAIALMDDGWYLRSEIIWHKPNPMPESVEDRPTKAHEMIYLLAKSESYWYDADAIREKSVGAKNREGFRGGNGRPYVHDSTFNNSYQSYKNLDVPGRSTNSMHLQRALGNDYTRNSEDRNKRSVWTVPTEPTPFAHFATFPQKLIEPMILAGCPVNGIVLDPFMGSGTTALVARKHGRRFIGSELNPAYAAIARERLALPYTPMFAELVG